MVKNPNSLCMTCEHIYENPKSHKYKCSLDTQGVRKGLRIYYQCIINDTMADNPSCKFYRPIKEEIIELKHPSVETGTVEEHILCAAIWVNDGAFHEHQPKNISTGYVISGRRHNNCFATIVDLIGLEEAIELRKYHNLRSQGFITNLDRFVDRKEAWEIALAAKQIRYGLEAVDKENTILISENLY